MIKSNYLFMLLNFYPIIINLMMILIMSIPSKNHKFNPITLILMLIILTMMITMKIYFMINSWGSFSLFLTMIGGLMIIFMYITSLANNELFKLNYKNILINLMKITPLILIILIFNVNYFDWMNTNIWMNMFINNYNLNFYEMFTSPYNNITFFSMNYLLYSMICIMNICYKFKLPLRQLFY